MQDIQPASPLVSLARVLASSARHPGRVSALTPVALALPRVVLDAQHIARYAAVCGFAPASTVPLTYPQMLTFPLLMHYLGSGACPWPAMGTVHLANSITQHAPLAAGDAVRIELQTGELLAHEKGQVFTLHLRVLRAVQDAHGSPRRCAPRDDGGDVVASGAPDEGVKASEARPSHDTLECVWQATQTLLRLGVDRPVGAPFASHALADVGADELPLLWQGSFDVPADTGRRYAQVSGDFNPIHLWPLTAQLLGFRRAIAHGLWTQARALALLQPDGVWPQAALQTVFKRPLLLPAQATVWQAASAPDQQCFEVRDAAGQVPHLRARLTLDAHHASP